MKATEATTEIQDVLGKDALSYHMAKYWFQRFKEGDYGLEDKPRSGRPTVIDDDALKAMIESDPKLTSRELEELLGVSHSAILDHLHRLGKVWKYGQYVPHELSEWQLMVRANCCAQLLSYHRTLNWVTNIVTGDEKWVMYVNHTRKRQWHGPGHHGEPTPKPELHPKRIMLCVWWTSTGVIYWELLPDGHAVTPEEYSRQLDRVAENARGKMEQVFFLHSNTRPEIAKVVRQKVMENGWSLLPHPQYSPDLAPSDYHLFKSLSSHLGAMRFDCLEDLKTALSDFFDSRDPGFYARGIESLPERWQRVMDTDGEYYV
ncbi:unnamed protein product [Bursaphelenchus xylophilus]|uniref:(pine wood nematode) hypothetical protein n=1 Tax=Bursaphelenchus xylophilus TaxID=6326 RepID=A0A1I7SX81_BURXY|nr:unnamed protein product [Bursaphelenchus xylophilus]CAG9100244.1 unnamed protein product [Bursaphelenchus xylophilus]